MIPPDHKFMKRALTLARKGFGKTKPNPAVGCVIVKNGKIIGEGWHKRAGGHHAEIYALEMAGSNAQGSDVYVTLEPCSHTGKTPPCCDKLIGAGVKRVVAGMTDPNPQVDGRGLLALQKAGIDTVCGVMEEECRDLNRSFIKLMTTGKPYVTYKCAMTLDGKTATMTGDSRWISSAESRSYVHKLRAENDAIMVGVNTVIADNPELTVRHIKGDSPLRVIVDSKLRTPENAKVLSETLSHGTLLATTETDLQLHLPYIQAGATVIICESLNGRVNMNDLLSKLGERGVQSILLEGGSCLAGDALLRGLIDECIFFFAPKVIGSDGLSPFKITGNAAISDSTRFNELKIRRIGSDIMVVTRPELKCSQD
ncbi:MAG: bifunctional diaminohydroxyphosphoribosylaminopyrimidine deaminase/5-amino-6-(5-phosphoribosylamino)uracil reductase RibD [Desulfuromonadaceae bacterium]|nr:bifunctional diaminohydroxyphosphoribosylaminopyrimidine deaminase/5-amino-6-(5-phosphoribosylamino)uracil reductase RibD [Desulfuromonadaceae bacterium]MDD2856748.1 bifunctional diaminohydroxyphosphoribosylaminopyrimidine deaminase/5-amino-6-(5-phosphoribosylamino)uracil reductase RibD [Desulfuromonadaceae bacterium]